MPPSCPDRRRLLAYLEDQLSPDLRRQVEEHLAVCEGCRKVMDELAMADASAAIRAGVLGPAGPIPGGSHGNDTPGPATEERKPDIAGYEIGKRLGTGGMGTVYLA